MKIITYLGFTFLSVLIQFCVMDFIQERQVEEKVDLNGTSQKKHLRDVVKEIRFKPHALYYQTKLGQLKTNDTPLYSYNISENDDYTTTDYSTTVLDDLFIDNSTYSVETYTSEPTDYDNVTEITFFGQNNDTTSKPASKPKKTHKDCNCNFLYKVCDIGCCCDDDCSDMEVKLFPNCAKNITISKKQDDGCYSSLINFSHEGPAYRILDSLLCIVKTNLPDDKKVFNYEKFELEQLKNNQFLTWKVFEKPKVLHEFSNKLYEYGDILGVLKNSTISHIEIPSVVMNSYCSGRKPITFLKKEKIACKGKILDIEMLKIMNNFESPVISATLLSMNHSVVNCTNAHCTNWTILVCDNLKCQPYNKSLHEPFCTERICTNLALKIHYIFYYHDAKITNATIKFYIQNVPMNFHYLEQNIDVDYVLANESIDHILKLSGNPGYIEGLPVIMSYVAENHTQNYFNTSVIHNKRHFALPNNQNGNCIPGNSENVIVFGRNFRISCKLRQEHARIKNRTMDCKNIQDSIYQFLSLTKNMSISPLGNPQDLKDIDWILMRLPISTKEPVFGDLKSKTSILHCYHLITRYSFTFSFARIDGNNKILAITLNYTGKNVTLNLEDASTIITIDINFIDVTKPSVFEIPAGPNLNLRLPHDFFYPFNSNGSSISGNIIGLILCYCIKMFASK